MSTILFAFAIIFFQSFVASATPSSSRLAGPPEVIARLDQVSTFDFSRKLKLGAAGTILTEPIIRAMWAGQLVSNSDWIGIQGLLSIHSRIDPGGAKDDASNMFLYTCKGGWVDVGHVILSAIAYKTFLQALGGRPLILEASTFSLEPNEKTKLHNITAQFLVKNTATDGHLTGDITMWAGYFAMRAGFRVERVQNDVKQGSKPGSFDANATSAYTLEDLASDYYGLQIGSKLERGITVRGVVNSFKREITYMMEDLATVKLDNKLKGRNCPKTAREAMESDASYYADQAEKTYAINKPGASEDPKNVYNFTIKPKRTLRHNCLCDSSGMPIAN